MQLKDIFSASSDGVSQPSNSTLRFKQKALAASILAARTPCGALADAQPRHASAG